MRTGAEVPDAPSATSGRPTARKFASRVALSGKLAVQWIVSAVSGNCLLPMSKAHKSVPFSFEHCSAKSYILSGVLVALSCLVTVGLLFCIALSSEDAVDRSVCAVCVRALASQKLQTLGFK